MKRRDFLYRTAAATMAAPLIYSQSTRVHAKDAGAKYRACVIGDTQQGGYGHNLHMMWALRDDVEVVGLADPDEAGRAQRAEECDAQRTYADYREMLETEQPDLVSIAPRWTIHHKEYLLACAEVGAHGIIEKPFTVDLAESDAVIDAMQAKNLKWTIAFNFRAAAEVAHAKHLIMEEGLIGELLEVRGRGKEDHRAGGEDLVVLGVHNFDMMCYFLGKPQWCMADITQDGRQVTPEDVREASEPLGPVVGDSIHAIFGFDNAVQGSFASKKHEDEFPGRWGLDFYGSRGIATIRMTTMPQIAFIEEPTWAPGGRNSEWQRLPDRPQVERREPLMVMQYAPIIDDLIKAIEEDRAPKVNLEDGRNATEMIQAVFETPLHGGRVDLPLTDREHPLPRWQ